MQWFPCFDKKIYVYIVYNYGISWPTTSRTALQACWKFGSTFKFRRRPSFRILWFSRTIFALTTLFITHPFLLPLEFCMLQKVLQAYCFFPSRGLTLDSYCALLPFCDCWGDSFDALAASLLCFSTWNNKFLLIENFHYFYPNIIFRQNQ